MNDYTLYLVKRAYYKKQLIKQATQDMCGHNCAASTADNTSTSSKPRPVETKLQKLKRLRGIDNPDFTTDNTSTYSKPRPVETQLQKLKRLRSIN